MSEGPLPSVRGPVRAASAVMVHAGTALLLRRAKSCLYWPEYWCPPGGGCEPGESFLDAALRELREETGIADVPLQELTRQRVAVQNSPEMNALPNPPTLLRSRIGDPVEYVSHWGRIDRRPTVVLDPSEHEDWAWITLADLAHYRVIPWDQEPLRIALKKP